MCYYAYEYSCGERTSEIGVVFFANVVLSCSVVVSLPFSIFLISVSYSMGGAKSIMLPPYRFITSGAVSSFTLGISLLSWSIALKSFSFVFAIKYQYFTSEKCFVFSVQRYYFFVNFQKSDLWIFSGEICCM